MSTAIIEDTVEQAIISLLTQTTSGITILRGMEDQSPNMSLPALVVQARMDEREQGRHEIYRVPVTIEYKSIPEENTVAGGSGVEATLGQIDVALTTQPSSGVLSGLTLVNGVTFIAWHSLNRTQQEVHTDRRTNTREILVTLSFA